MSATPIPRTLYLALVGARDLSVIETPPRERLPIRTVVRSYDERLVRDAVKAHLRELYRRFEIDGLPQIQKRTALVRIAIESGLVRRET